MTAEKAASVINQHSQLSHHIPQGQEARAVETAGSNNNYQLVVRQDDLAKRTATSFQMNATQEVSAHDLDNYHVYEALKQRENEYMAQN